MYSSLTYANRSFIKRFSHGRRMEIARQIINEYEPKSILDFGSGDGAIFLTEDFLNIFASNVVLYEPVLYEELNDNLNSIQRADEIVVKEHLPIETFEMVTCFEVLEHFQGSNLMKRLSEISSLMSFSSNLVVSIPVETGVSGFVKNCLRAILGQQHANSTMLNVVKSLFGMQIKRVEGAGGYIETHIGFNHNSLEKTLTNFGFKTKCVRYSPINMPGLRYFSSQKFYICTK